MLVFIHFLLISVDFILSKYIDLFLILHYEWLFHFPLGDGMHWNMIHVCCLLNVYSICLLSISYGTFQVMLDVTACIAALVSLNIIANDNFIFNKEFLSSLVM